MRNQRTLEWMKADHTPTIHHHLDEKEDAGEQDRYTLTLGGTTLTSRCASYTPENPKPATGNRAETILDLLHQKDPTA